VDLPCSCLVLETQPLFPEEIQQAWEALVPLLGCSLDLQSLELEGQQAWEALVPLLGCSLDLQSLEVEGQQAWEALVPLLGCSLDLFLGSEERMT